MKTKTENVNAAVGAVETSGLLSHPYRIGSNYFIRTVTFYYTGKLVGIFPGELVLTNAAWIPDSGRLSEFLQSGIPSECEPYPEAAQLVINRTSVVEALLWVLALPRSTK